MSRLPTLKHPLPKVCDFVGSIAAGPLTALALPSLLAKSVSLFSLHFLKEDMRRQQVSRSVMQGCHLAILSLKMFYLSLVIEIGFFL